MTRKLAPLLATLVLAVAFAGCGGGEKGSSTTAGTTATNFADQPQVKDAIARCKDSIDQNSAIEDKFKADLKGVCEKISSGDPDAIAKATRAVCETLIDKTLPAGDARDQAKQKACSGVGN